MSIKDDVQYKYYINWLNYRLENKTINKGQYELLKISESLFLEYCFRFNNQHKFKQAQEDLYKTYNRDTTIDDILDNDFQ